MEEKIWVHSFIIIKSFKFYLFNSVSSTIFTNPLINCNYFFNKKCHTIHKTPRECNLYKEVTTLAKNNKIRPKTSLKLRGWPLTKILTAWSQKFLILSKLPSIPLKGLSIPLFLNDPKSN